MIVWLSSHMNKTITLSEFLSNSRTNHHDVFRRIGIENRPPYNYIGTHFLLHSHACIASHILFCYTDPLNDPNEVFAPLSHAAFSSGFPTSSTTIHFREIKYSTGTSFSVHMSKRFKRSFLNLVHYIFF